MVVVEALLFTFILQYGFLFSIPELLIRKAFASLPLANEKSKPLIKLQMKALVARDLWEMNEYYQIMDADNESLQKAINILQTTGAYEKILK